MKNISNSFILIYEDDSLKNTDVNKKNFVQYSLSSLTENHLDAVPTIIDNTIKDINRLSLISGEYAREVNIGTSLSKNNMTLREINLDNPEKYYKKLKQVQEIVDKDEYDEINTVNRITKEIYKDISNRTHNYGILQASNSMYIKSITSPFIIFGLDNSIKDKLEEELNKVNKLLSKIALYYNFISNYNAFNYSNRDLFNVNSDEYVFKSSSEKSLKLTKVPESDLSSEDYKEFLEFILEDLKNEVDNNDYENKDELEKLLKETDNIKCANILVSAENKKDNNYDLVLDIEYTYDFSKDKEELEELSKIEKSKVIFYILNYIKILYLNQSDNINHMTSSFDTIRKSLEKAKTFDEALKVVEENVDEFIQKNVKIKNNIPKDIKDFHKISVNL